ncbi:glycosyltransferase [Luteimicrobium sp. DT211]|uniref:glycosyltransferase n=1 Tax=Luteimicrobium sp. DT211 TaxID=3393412 RepID=UPI003CF20AD5
MTAIGPGTGMRGGGELHVYMVVGILGRGGMTSAMMNRARMFADHGVRTTIVTLQHDLEHASRNAEYTAMGWLDPRVEVVNAFDDAAHALESSLPTEPHGLAARLRTWLPSRRRRARPAPARVADEAGLTVDVQRRDDGSVRRVEHRDAEGSAVRVTEYDASGALRHETDLDPAAGDVLEERFLTPSGHVYLRRSYLEGGSPSACFALDREGKVKRRYSGQTAWQAAYLTRLARRSPGNAVFICDGPGSASKVFRIPRRDAATLYMVHNNHFKSPWRPGAPVRDDYGAIFERADDMDALVVLTDEQARDIGDQFGNFGKIRVVPNSVATEPVEASERSPRTVSMFSRLVGQKNLPEAVALFADVVARVPDAVLDIYGEGRLDGQLRALVTKKGLEGSVRLRGYSRDALGTMARSAMVLCTSHYEGLPVNFLEAYRTATPVVSYACRYGPRDLIDDGVTGFVVPFGDRAAVVDRIVRILEDPALGHRMGAQGQRSILSQYSNDAVFGTWWRVLTEAHEHLVERRGHEAMTNVDRRGADRVHR